jgi:hypothetical protein
LLQKLVDMAVELLVRKVELGDNPARVLGKAHCEDARRWRGECERRVSGADALVADGELRGQRGQRPEECGREMEEREKLAHPRRLDEGTGRVYLGVGGHETELAVVPWALARATVVCVCVCVCSFRL